MYNQLKVKFVNILIIKSVKATVTAVRRSLTVIIWHFANIIITDKKRNAPLSFDTIWIFQIEVCFLERLRQPVEMCYSKSESVRNIARSGWMWIGAFLRIATPPLWLVETRISRVQWLYIMGGAIILLPHPVAILFVIHFDDLNGFWQTHQLVMKW